MPPVATHPSPERLEAFGLGKLSDDDAIAIADHLSGCASCCREIEALPDDPLLSLVRPLFDSDATMVAAESWFPPELANHPRYRLVEWLGAGGMGVVYKAEHRLMQRLVALKIIRKKLTARAEAVERFQREVRAAARLSHPNIVAAYDADQVDDLHFLVTEFVAGVSLDRIVSEQGPLPIARACDYACQAASGLQHAYERGMVHRDIKPQNLMVSCQGQVKILDLGLAGFAAEGGGSITEYGQILGTPDYVAPEQVRDAHAADIRADIYSLGGTLYFLLTGQPPFPGGTVINKIAAHLDREPTPLDKLRPDTPAALVRLVQRLLAKEPAHRFQKPAEVVEALTPFVQEGHVPVRRTGNWRWLSGSIPAALLLLGWIGHQQTRTAPPQSQSVEERSIEDVEDATSPQQEADVTPHAGDMSVDAEKANDISPIPDKKKIDPKKVSSTDGKSFVD